MKAVKGLALTVVAAYYGLAVVGAIGNRSWWLLALLVTPLVVVAVVQLRRVVPAFARARKGGAS